MFCRLTIVATLSIAGCARTARPPQAATVSEYCLESAEEAEGRALRARAFAVGALSLATLSLAAAPFVSRSTDDEGHGVAAGSAMVGVAVGAALLSRRWADSATHNSAIAGGFAECIDAGDGHRAFFTARVLYQLWIRPDVSRAELIHAQLPAPTLGPPPPPPFADEPSGPPPGDDDNPILEASLRSP